MGARRLPVGDRFEIISRTRGIHYRMKRRLFENFRAPLLPGIVALTAFSALGANTTYTFRNGTNSYTGSSDFAINTQYSQYNGGNGIQWKGGSELGCYNVTDANPYSVRYLLKFASLGIPAGSQVVSAQLAIWVDYWDSG